jgi:hypothetical protein
MAFHRKKLSSTRTRRVLHAVAVICIIFQETVLLPQAYAIKAKWTPTDESDGPLPLSQNQRNQLSKLAQTIQNAPDSQGALEKAAQVNNMDSNELLRLLERNEKDMIAAQHSGGGGSRLGQRRITAWNVASAMVMAALHWVAKHPRWASLMGLALVGLLCLLQTAPRTGVVLSNQRSFLSRGPTTLFHPPVEFLQNYALQSDQQQNESWIGQQDNLFIELAPLLNSYEDGSMHHNCKGTNLQQAVSHQVTLSAIDLVQDEDVLDEACDLSMEHAADLLQNRQVTELVPERFGLRMIATTGTRKQSTILVVKGLGDWNRYGLISFKVKDESADDARVSLTLSSVGKGHIDGQLHFVIEQTNTGIVISVHLLVPTHGQTLNRKNALRIVEGLGESIAASIRLRTQQSLARRMQSSSFKRNASKRALDRRKSRFDKEKAIESMAINRRRRWQRGNPNSGSYRPSGDRMRSPNNS